MLRTAWLVATTVGALTEERLLEGLRHWSADADAAARATTLKNADALARADGPALALRLFSEAQADAFGARCLDGSPSGASPRGIGSRRRRGDGVGGGIASTPPRRRGWRDRVDGSATTWLVGSRPTPRRRRGW